MVPPPHAGMREVRFGDFTLNRFFWDSIAPMETPLDYVTRLSLTFEQANLDYAHHYFRAHAPGRR